MCRPPESATLTRPSAMLDAGLSGRWLRITVPAGVAAARCLCFGRATGAVRTGVAATGVREGALGTKMRAGACGFGDTPYGSG